MQQISSSSFDSSDLRLKSISISSDNQNYTVENDILYNKAKTTLVCYPPYKSGDEFTLPETVTSLAYGAFWYNQYLETIKGLDQITEMYDMSVFANCQKLKEVSLTGLTTESLPAYTFNNASIQKVTLSAKITSFSCNEFCGCKNLTEIHFRTATPPTIVFENYQKEFNGCNENLTFYVPKGCVDNYLNDADNFANADKNAFAGDNLVDHIAADEYEIVTSATIQIMTNGLVAVYDGTGNSIDISNTEALGDDNFIYTYNCTVGDRVTLSATPGLSTTFSGWFGNFTKEFSQLGDDDYALSNCLATETNLEYEIESETNRFVALFLPDFEYSYTTDNTATFEKYNGSDISVTIPATVMYDGVEHTVTTIAPNAFKDNTKLEYVIFDNGSQVASIGAYAFWGCSNLRELTLPASVGYIGPYVCETSNTVVLNAIFDMDGTWYDDENCSSSINSGDVYSGAYELSYGMWRKTSNETGFQYRLYKFNGSNYASITGYNGSDVDIEIPAKAVIDEVEYTITSIGDEAFKENANLHSVTFAESSQIDSIGANAFYWCERLDTITLSNMTYIGGSAFQNCTSLRVVNIPSGVQLEANAFVACSKATIFVPEDWSAEDYNNLFYDAKLVVFSGSPESTSLWGASKIAKSDTVHVAYNSVLSREGTTLLAYIGSESNVEVLNGVTTIGTEAFYRCSFETLVIPNSVSTINADAFGYASMAISMPSSINKIEQYAFRNSSNVTFTNFDPTNWYSDEGCIEDIDMSNFMNGDVIDASMIVSYNNQHTMWYEIPTVETTLDNLYSTIDGLDRSSIIKVTSGVMSDSELSGEDAELQTHLRSLYESKPYVMVSLDLSGVEGLTKLDYYAFGYTNNLVSVTIPASVGEINGYAFAYSTALAEINVDEESEYFVSENGVLYNYDKTKLVRYPVAKPGSSFTVPDDIETLGWCSFAGCRYLKNVYIPDGVQLEEVVFQFNEVIEHVQLPEDLAEIPGSTFQECVNLQEITIPQNVTSIGAQAFSSCQSLTEVIIPDGVETIEHSAFSGCYDIETLEIPNSVSHIGRGALPEISDIENFTLTFDTESDWFYDRECIKPIDKNLYMTNEKLDVAKLINLNSTYYVEIDGESVENPGMWKNTGFTFNLDWDNTTLTGYNGTAKDVVIPTNVFVQYSVVYPVKSISATAFRGNTNIESVSFKSSSQVTAIPEYAFAGCTALVSINLPLSVNYIGENIALECSNLETLTFNTNVRWYSDPEHKSEIDESEYLEGGEISISKFKTLNSSTALYSEAYISGNGGGGNTGGGQTGFTFEYDESYLTATVTGYEGSETIVEIPSTTSYDGNEYTVTAIGENAFANNSNLQSVTFADGSQVETIGNNAFYYCYSLTSITIPAEVTTIGSQAFYNCYKLQPLLIPNSVEVIGSQAFYYNLTLFCEAPSKPDGWDDNWQRSCIVSWGFSEIPLYGYADIDDQNKTLTITSYNGTETELTIPATLKIGEDDYAVTAIGNSAFHGKSITKVSFAENCQITTIGERAFSGCSSMTSITLPESITTINRFAFSSCSSLTTLTIPKNVVNLEPDYTFTYCPSLQEINVDEENTKFSSDDGVLYEGTTLWRYPSAKSGTSFTIPESITQIEYNAFQECMNLQVIELPSTVTYVDNYAFGGSTTLAAINVNVSAGEFSAGGFYSDNGILYKKDGEKSILYRYPQAKAGDAFAVTVDSIYSAAFAECQYLKSVYISGGVGMDEVVFQSNEVIEHVTFPSDLIEIPGYTFQGCSSLKSIAIPATVKKIGSTAFQSCYNLETIYFGGTEEDKDKMYIDDNCNEGLQNAELTWVYRTYPAP